MNTPAERSELTAKLQSAIESWIRPSMCDFIEFPRLLAGLRPATFATNLTTSIMDHATDSDDDLRLGVRAFLDSPDKSPDNVAAAIRHQRTKHPATTRMAASNLVRIARTLGV